MPMKWTPENDQLLLLKILETHDLSVDTKKVAEAWPAGEGQDRPTPRAITERLVRMRSIVKSTGSADGHFSIGRGNGSASANSTPRKARKMNSNPATPSSGKRKRPTGANGGVDLDLEDENLGSTVKMEVEDMTPTKKPLHPTLAGMNQRNMQMQMGSTLNSDTGSPLVGEVTPTKRARRTSALGPGMVNYTFDEDRVDEVESSSSEYMPEETVKMEDDADVDYA